MPELTLTPPPARPDSVAAPLSPPRASVFAIGVGARSTPTISPDAAATGRFTARRGLLAGGSSCCSLDLVAIHARRSTPRGLGRGTRASR